jgi:hypothetical protein
MTAKRGRQSASDAESGREIAEFREQEKMCWEGGVVD